MLAGHHRAPLVDELGCKKRGATCKSSCRRSIKQLSPASSILVLSATLNRVIVWPCRSPGVDALVYQAGLAIDADGAFRAYDRKDRLGLDIIQHADRPGNWWALATDTGKPSGRPVVQGSADPGIPDERDPRRFVDAVSIPYVVLPPAGLKQANLGDFAAVLNVQNGRVAGALVADEVQASPSRSGQRSSIEREIGRKPGDHDGSG